MSRHQPALLGGIFVGVFSALPVIGGANLCCCLWVVLGGMLTVYLQQQNRPEPVDAASAVLGGLMAGLIGAAINSVAIMFMASGPMFEESVRNALDSNPQFPGEMRDAVLNLVSGRNWVMLVAAITFPVYSVFCMLGALLGVALFRKKTPPAAVV